MTFETFAAPDFPLHHNQVNRYFSGDITAEQFLGMVKNSSVVQVAQMFTTVIRTPSRFASYSRLLGYLQEKLPTASTHEKDTVNNLLMSVFPAATWSDLPNHLEGRDVSSPCPNIVFVFQALQIPSFAQHAQQVLAVGYQPALDALCQTMLVWMAKGVGFVSNSEKEITEIADFCRSFNVDLAQQIGVVLKQPQDVDAKVMVRWWEEVQWNPSAISLASVETIAQTGTLEDIEKMARNVDGELLAQKNSELLYSLLRPLADSAHPFTNATNPTLSVLAKHGNPIMCVKTRIPVWGVGHMLHVSCLLLPHITSAQQDDLCAMWADRFSSAEVNAHLQRLRTNPAPLAQNFTHRCDALRMNGALTRATMGVEAEEIVAPRPARRM